MRPERRLRRGYAPSTDGPSGPVSRQDVYNSPVLTAPDSVCQLPLRARGASDGTAAAAGGLTSGDPALDLRPKPQHGTAATEVDHWPGHVRITGLVLAHRVAVRKAEDLGHVASINQIVYEHSVRHAQELTPVSGSSLRV